jgi:CheY-like chemotaxis protein
LARILLVDDNVEFRGLLNSILTGDNHSVVCAGDGNEAISHFHSKPFDLVITDLVMPDKEGLETIIELRRTHPTVKIIAMTGGSRNAANYLMLAESFGVSHTLTKPFSRDILLQAVNSTLNAF